MNEMKPAAYLISNATARELLFDPLAPDDKWHSYSTPPVETPLYTIPADQVLVPMELFKRLLDHIEYDAIGSPSASTASDLAYELRTLLHP